MGSAFYAMALYCRRKTERPMPQGGFAMSLFTRKESLVFKTEQQRDAYIERLDAAHVKYEVSENRDNVFRNDVNYIIRLAASDLKKVS